MKRKSIPGPDKLHFFKVWARTEGHGETIRGRHWTLERGAGGVIQRETADTCIGRMRGVARGLEGDIAALRRLREGQRTIERETMIHGAFE